MQNVLILFFRVFGFFVSTKRLQVHYLNLGERQSLFTEKTERSTLIDMYDAYRRYLNRQTPEFIDPAFHALRGQEDRYSALIIDESQDFSFLQLDNLRQIASDRRVAYCIDNHQSLYDMQPVKPFLLKILSHGKQPVTNITLNISHRCPSTVLELAKRVLNIKHHLTGGKSDKEDYTDILSPQGTGQGNVRWLPEQSLTQDQHQALQQEALSTNFAIITCNEHIEEAKKRFDTPLVFSSADVKGLEYPSILIYRPLDTPEMVEANTMLRHLPQKDLATQKIHRAKKGQSHPNFVQRFNHLFTAITRATHTVFVIQDSNHSIQNLLDALQAQPPIISETSPSPSQGLSQPAPSSSKDWYEEARRLFLEGHITQAREITRMKLSATELEQFKKFEEEQSKLKLHPIQQSQPKQALDEADPTANKPISNPKVSSASSSSNPAASSGSKKSKSTGKVLKASEQQPSDDIKQAETNGLSIPANASFEDYCRLFDAFFQEPNARQQLFKPTSTSEHCLLTYFINNQKNAVSLMCYLGRATQEQQLHVKRTIDTLFFTHTLQSGETAIYYMSKTPWGRRLLVELLKKNPILKNFSPEAFCFGFSDRPFELASPLYHFITSEDFDVLGSLLDLFFDEIDGIELFTNNKALTNALCKPLCTELQTVNHPNLLSYLTFSEKGMLLLKYLIEKHKHLAQHLPIDSFCLPLTRTWPDDSSKTTKLSPFGSLCNSHLGISIFRKLLETNESFATQLPGSALCLMIHGSKVLMNATPLSSLVSLSPEGAVLLNTLIQNNKILAHTFSIDALCLAFGPERDQLENVSPLYSLSLTEDGCLFLKTLFTRNPLLAQKLPREALCRKLTSKVGEDKNTSPLSLLAEKPVGIEVLRLLIKEQPALLKYRAIQKTAQECGILYGYKKQAPAFFFNSPPPPSTSLADEYIARFFDSNNDNAI